MIRSLKDLDTSERQRVLQMVRMYFDSDPYVAAASSQTAVASVPSFTENVRLTPKEFILDKRPTSDIERVACLAFYLSHYNGQQHFKTKDISLLNSDAKQAPFSNAAQAMKNAQLKGFVVPAAKGFKQLSAVGERFVQALPNREEALTAFKAFKPKQRKKKKLG